MPTGKRKSDSRVRANRIARDGGWSLRVRRWRIVSTICVVGLIAASGATPHASAQEGTIDRSHSIRAGYIYNFGKYVEWNPANNRSSTFNIGIVGKTPITQKLNVIANSQRLKSKRIIVRQIKKKSDLKGCQIVFFASDVRKNFDTKLLDEAKKMPILTVGESPGFAQSGGIMNFFIENNKTKFEINQAVANNVGLKISPKVLRLGKIVNVSKED